MIYVISGTMDIISIMNIAYCLLPNTYCLLTGAYCLLPVASSQAAWPLCSPAPPWTTAAAAEGPEQGGEVDWGGYKLREEKESRRQSSNILDKNQTFQQK